MWSRSLIPLRTGWAISRCRLSVTAQKETAEIDDFLQSITSSPPVTSTKQRKVLETSAEFSKWLKDHPVQSIEQFIAAAQIAITVKSSERKEVFAKINNMASSVLPTFYEKLGVKETVDSLRFVLQMTPRSRISQDIQKIFIEKNISASDLTQVQFETLVMIIRYADQSVDQKVLNTVVQAITERIDKELNNTAHGLALLAGTGYPNSNWFKNEKFTKKIENLIAVMGMAEKCALIKYMANSKQRNRQLLGALVYSICYSGECLTVSQIVTLANACVSLTYYPPKMSKKVSEDLLKNSNVLDNWADVLIITDAFVKMRMGEPKTWNLIVRWTTENVKKATFEQLSRLVSGLAQIGEPSGKPLAKSLKPHLNLTRARNPNAWLNIVYSLAYFQELDESHADSVLNKSFVEQIMSSTPEPLDRLRKAMTLMMISTAAKVDLKEKYKGPTVQKETFARFGIKFDKETTQQAQQLKYSKNMTDVEETFFKSLSKLAPEGTHWRSSNIEDCGAFVDAYVMPAQNTALLVNTNQWGSHKSRPIFYHGWTQTKMNVETTGEELMTGPAQTALRLMRANGYNPIVVFKTEFDYCANDIDKVNMLREKIHKTL